MKSIAVLASGSGTNLQAVIDRIEAGELPAALRCVVSDRRGAFALERARRRGIPAFFLDPKTFPDRGAHEGAVAEVLERHGVELVVLAGWMRLLGAGFLRRFPQRVINIHPALLPAFPGTRGYEDAWAYGVKVSGCTVHFVDEGCDTGPIILQAVNPVREEDTFESFRARGWRSSMRPCPRPSGCSARAGSRSRAGRCASGRAEAAGFRPPRPPPSRRGRAAARSTLCGS